MDANYATRLLQAERRFVAQHNSDIRRHKEARLAALNEGCTDPVEIKARQWVSAWITNNSPTCSAEYSASFAQMSVQYQHFLITSVIEVSTWCTEDTLQAIASLGPMIGKDLELMPGGSLDAFRAFVDEYRKVTLYPSRVLDAVAAMFK